MALVGNIDVRVLETGCFEKIRKEILYKLQAARGGGWVAQSDHSITSDVAPESYEYMVSLIRKYGVYPLRLEE